jgi:hypothetical protein
MSMEVDIVVLSRISAPLRREVGNALRHQVGVRLKLHRIIAGPVPNDANRWSVIARGRNDGKRLGSSPWIMFVDDDVVLERNCVQLLIDELCGRAEYAALAADYLGESTPGYPAHHVAMGATLFRRRALERIKFRWEPGKCECQCCCDDLRRLRMGIAYSAHARAKHLKPRVDHGAACDSHCRPVVETQAVPGRILTAFNHGHWKLFRNQFLPSLRAAGNQERVTVVGYGLRPSERHALARLDGVELISRPPAAVPARRRLRDFQTAVARFAPDTPVAYWDAGDVVFQASLQPLWQRIREHPDKLLAACEAAFHPENRAISGWTRTIIRSDIRRQAFRMLSKCRFLNAGFAAGTARAMLRYLRFGEQLRESGALAGTANRGDQLVFNLYCHGNPEAWLEMEQGWNFCLFGRDLREVYRRRGHYFSRRGTPIYVIHGNARTLPLVGLGKRYY